MIRNTSLVQHSLKLDVNHKLHSHINELSSTSYCLPLYNYHENSLSIHIHLIISIYPFITSYMNKRFAFCDSTSMDVKYIYNPFNLIHYQACYIHPFLNHSFLFDFCYINCWFSCFYFNHLTNTLTPNTSHI